jgi:hypothetical protein
VEAIPAGWIDERMERKRKVDESVAKNNVSGLHRTKITTF